MVDKLQVYIVNIPKETLNHKNLFRKKLIDVMKNDLSELLRL